MRHNIGAVLFKLALEMNITKKQNDTCCAIAMTTCLVPVLFCQTPNTPICNPLKGPSQPVCFAGDCCCFHPGHW